MVFKFLWCKEVQLCYSGELVEVNGAAKDGGVCTCVHASRVRLLKKERVDCGIKVDEKHCMMELMLSKRYSLP